MPIRRAWWIDEDHYDKIFLVTEDTDIINQMREEF